MNSFFRCVVVFLFGAGGIKEGPEKHSEVGPTGVSTPPAVFSSFLLFFSIVFFPMPRAGRKYGAPSAPIVLSKGYRFFIVFYFEGQHIFIVFFMFLGFPISSKKMTTNYGNTMRAFSFYTKTCIYMYIYIYTHMYILCRPRRSCNRSFTLSSYIYRHTQILYGAGSEAL